MVTKTDLAKSCKTGRIELSAFCELLGSMRPRRTHLLDKGDYVVLTPISAEDVFRAENACRGAVLIVEEITELDAPERGDFVTSRGTDGPINGNVFIKIQKDNFPRYLLIEGDRIEESNCPVSVYDLVNKYINARHSQN